MWVAVISYEIYGASIAILGDMEILFYTDSLEKLPICLCINLIYAILSYVGYRILNVIARSYRKESKVQNGLAIGFIAFMVVSEAPMYYSIVYCSGISEQSSGKRKRPYPAAEKRGRGYYMQLEKNQLAIRKMRHDMLDYIQTLQRLSDDEVKRREILKELEERLAE